MTQFDHILKSKLSICNADMLDSKQRIAVEETVAEFTAIKINKYRSEQNKEVALEAIKLFPAILKGQLILWLRKRAFKRACKEAFRLACLEGYKHYVIRSSTTKYVIMSTLDVRKNKQLRIFGKNVDAVKLEETAAYVAKRPDNYVFFNQAKSRYVNFIE